MWGCGGDHGEDGASGGGGGVPGDDDAGSGGLAGGASNPAQISCHSESDCDALHIAGVEDCAEVDCDYKEYGQCTLKARDQDGDGYRDECQSNDDRILVHQKSGEKIIEKALWDCNPYRPDIHPKAWDGPAVGSERDACDGIDTDCDGRTDNDEKDGISCECSPKEFRRCALVEATQEPSQFLQPFTKNGAQPLKGACSLGTTVCDSKGRWGLCVGAIEPKKEACDSLSLDLDCNGVLGKDELEKIESARKAQFLCDDDGDDQVPANPREAFACVEARKELPEDCGQWRLASTINKSKVDCDDQNDQVGAGFRETCDGVDSNCGGELSDAADLKVVLPDGGDNVTGYACIDVDGGVQVALTCQSGFANCDGHGPGGIMSGCEISIRTIANCGGCGVTCDFACSGNDAAAFSCAEVESFSAGRSHTCATLTDGRVSCWGRGEQGQIGDGQSLSHKSPVAALDIGLSVPKSLFIAAGGEHTCAITETNEVYCWGSGSYRQNGTPNQTTRDLRKPQKMPDTLYGARSLGLGWTHSCAVLGSGGIKCWGNQLEGRLGMGTLVLDEAGDPIADGLNTAYPAKINLTGTIDPDGGGIGEEMEIGAGGETSAEGQWTYFLAAEQVASGAEHTCALEDGKVYCAGSNSELQLGIGDEMDISHSLYFVPVPTLEGVSQIGSGLAFSCALKQGQVYCWGSNSLGQIGQSYYYAEAMGTPTRIENLSNVSQLAVGGTFACALSEGQVYCWGEGTQGQLGYPADYYYSFAPVAVAELTGATMIHAGSNHVCALMEGKLVCWGDNAFGQLGRGTEDDEPHFEPEPVKPLGP